MKKHLSLLAGVSMACIATGAAADEFVKLEPLYKNGNVIVPLFTQVDTDLDGYPDKLQIRYNVYTAGTNTKLLTTKTKTVNYPAVPCTSPVGGDRDFDMRFGGTLSANRTHTFLDLYTECQETTGEYKEAHTTVLYSANVTSTGASWLKAFSGWQLLGTDGVDYDSDGTTEAAVMMAKDVGTTTKGRLLFVQMSDGTIEQDNTYTVATVK